MIPHRRAVAGLQSLADRAEMDLRVIDVWPADGCSEHGDTDRRVVVQVGDDDSAPPDRRAARIAGAMILHRSVGRRATWRLADDVVIHVRATAGEWQATTLAEYRLAARDAHVGCAHARLSPDACVELEDDFDLPRLVLDRVVGELAARRVETMRFRQ